LAVATGGLVLVVKVELLKALFEGIYLPVVVVYKQHCVGWKVELLVRKEVYYVCSISIQYKHHGNGYSYLPGLTARG
jgi:hypothetical protein